MASETLENLQVCGVRACALASVPPESTEAFAVPGSVPEPVQPMQLFLSHAKKDHTT
jgi:hypothetical protein